MSIEALQKRPELTTSSTTDITPVQQQAEVVGIIDQDLQAELQEKLFTSRDVIKRLQISKTTLIALRKKANVEPLKKRKKDPQLYSEADILLMAEAKQNSKHVPYTDRVSALEICAELGINRETLRKVREIIGIEMPKIHRQGRYYTQSQRDAIAQYVITKRENGERLAPHKTLSGIRRSRQAVLLETYTALASQVAVGKFNNPDLIEVAQSALHEAVLKFDETRGAFPAFARKVITNKIIDDLRRRKTAQTMPLDPESPVYTRPSHEEDVDNKIFVTKIMESLNPKERQIIKLIFFAGLSYIAASKLLGTPEGTLKSRVRIALEKLRSHPHIKSVNKGL